MNIEIQQQYMLLVLIPILCVVLWIAHKGHFASKIRKVCNTATRLLLCTVLVLALSNPILFLTADTTTTIFAVDGSDSVKDQQQTIQNFLTQAQKAKQDKDALGLVSFGKYGVVEQSSSVENNITTGILSNVDKTASNIENGLEQSVSLLPTDTGRRIVLISDGNETTGDSITQAKEIAAQGIPIDVYALDTQSIQEVQLTSLEVAPQIHKNVQYELSLRIDATTDTTGEVRLYRDNTLIVQEPVSIRNGETRVVFSDIAYEGGAVTYRAELDADIDTMSENNYVYAYTYIQDVPHILIVEQNDSGHEWESMLSTQVETERKDISRAPSTIEDLSYYDGIVLANVSSDAWDDGFDTLLETYVRTTGGGLLVSGGEQSFALGSYQGTALEDVLPVEFDLETEQEDENFTMIMVLDTSGSMDNGNYGVTRIDMAKEAAIRSLENFQEGDRVGVLAFDSYVDWVAKPQNAKQNQSQLVKDIGSMQAGGGTSILPALQEAYTAMLTETTPQKHILLLTDGQAEQDGYDTLLQKMREQGITLSAVAIGDDADTKLLQYLAQNGGGRYYFTDEFTDLPEIFARELSLANREYINNRTFYPVVKNDSVILGEISQIPALHGYVSTTAKSRAEQVLISDLSEPILATWQYGLGRVVAWTSDAHGQWTADWLASQEGVTILRNAVSWIMKTQDTEDVRLTAEPEDNSSTIYLETAPDMTAQEIDITVVDQNQNSYEVSMKQTSPGVYEGHLPTSEQGAYTATVSVVKEDGVGFAYTGFYIAYPKEYDITTRQNGLQLLNELATITGGRMLTSGEEVFEGEAATSITERQLQQPLLLLSLLLLIFDIALRRFPMIFEKVEAMTVSNISKPKKEQNKTIPQNRIQTKQQKQPKTTKKQTNSVNTTKTSTTDILTASKKKRQR